MPRKRNKENQGLPNRWRFYHNAYYYRVPKGQEYLWDNKKVYRLGGTLSEAHRKFAERIDLNENIKTIGQLLDRYSTEVIPTKALKTQKDNHRQVKKLREVFGHNPINLIRPQHVYIYADNRKAKTAAKREIEVLSHAYSKAVEWGLIDRHPFKGQVTLKGSKPRERYVEDWEIIECLSLEPTRLKGSVLAIQAYIRLKLLTGLRKGDMLRLKISDIKEDGIHITTRKTGKPVIYEWTDELQESIQMAKEARPVDIS